MAVSAKKAAAALTSPSSSPFLIKKLAILQCTISNILVETDI